jgi:hypothetical protein
VRVLSGSAMPATHDGRRGIVRPGVRAGGLEPPWCRHQQDLNLPRIPIPPRPLKRIVAGWPWPWGERSGPARTPDPAFPTGQTPSSLRSRATCPVALTPYCACSIFPSGPTTNVDLITPTVVFPYIIFSPYAP